MAYDAVVGGGLGAFLLFTLVGQSLARFVGWSDSIGITLGALVAAGITYRFYRHEKALWEKGESARKIDKCVKELVHSLQETDQKNAGLYEAYTGMFAIYDAGEVIATYNSGNLATIEEVYGDLLDALIQDGPYTSCSRITMSIWGRNGSTLTDILYYEMQKDGAASTADLG